MSLNAYLTTSWEEISSEALSAKTLHEKAKGSGVYKDNLDSLIPKERESVEILALEQIFRRSPAGIGDIQKFVSALADINIEKKSVPDIICHIHAFSYAFLKAAKNYDFIMPPNEESLKNLKPKLTEWKNAVKALEGFERLGNEVPNTGEDLREDYLKLRNILARDTASDELRTLVVLLVTGPATSDDIQEDLGMSQHLSQRVIAALDKTNAIKTKAITIQNKDKTLCSINERTLPIVIFCVRELMGLDLLKILTSIEGMK